MPVALKYGYKPKSHKPVDYKYLRISDGDTPVIEMSVRMVSVDTPEKAGYAGGAAVAQEKLNRCRERLESGFFGMMDSDLASYLKKKLVPDAAQRHISAGERASEEFQKLLHERLTRPNGNKRRLGTIPAGELVDGYGRLLAYLTPWYAGGASDPLPLKGDKDRDTFNLNMIENGWGAFFPIYPSLPDAKDMNRAIEAAADAWDKSRGAWKEFGKDLLLAYEYRACIKLAGPIATARRGDEKRVFHDTKEFLQAKAGLDGWEIVETPVQAILDEAFQRYCVDLRNLSMVGKYRFVDVPPPYRLWIWKADLAAAKKDLGLKNFEAFIE